MNAKARIPAGPEEAPSRQALRLLRDPREYLLELRRTHGPVFTLRPLRFPTLVVVSDSKLAQQLFTSDSGVLRAGTVNRILEPATGDQSVFSLDEEQHLERRRLLLGALGQTHPRAYEKVVADAVRRELETWPVGEVVELYPRFRDIAAEVMLRVVLGADELGAWPRLKPHLFAMHLAASRQRARAIVAEVLAHRRRSPRERPHVLAALLSAAGRNDALLSDTAVVDELLALVLAGQETTAGTLAWAGERLCRNVDVQEKLRSAYSDGDERYVNAVVSEILRSRPVLQWSVRQLADQLALGDWLLPAGSVVAVSIYLVHHDPELYPEPGRFLPERFLGGSQPPPYAWIPFGGGVRRCIGARMATQEVSVALSQLLGRFELRTPEGSEDEEGQRRCGVAYVPAKGAPVRLLRSGSATHSGLPSGEGRPRLAYSRGGRMEPGCAGPTR
jgi:cytochrome P450 family 135